jgi:hypothetical protein
MRSESFVLQHGAVEISDSTDFRHCLDSSFLLHLRNLIIANVNMQTFM